MLGREREKRGRRKDTHQRKILQICGKEVKIIMLYFTETKKIDMSEKDNRDTIVGIGKSNIFEDREEKGKLEDGGNEMRKYGREK